MKRRIIGLLAAWTLALFLAACSGADSGAAGATSAGTETSAGTAPVSSSSSGEEDSRAYSFDLEQGGVGFDLPEKLRNLKGTIQPNYGVELGENTGIYVSGLTYCAMPEEKYEELMASGQNLSPEDIDYAVHRMVDILHVFAIDGKRSAEDLDKVLSSYGLPEEERKTLGSEGDYNFFYTVNPTRSFLTDSYTFDEGFREEYESLLPAFQDTSWIRIYEPLTEETAGAGTAVSFETTDLAGNAVSSADIFRKHKLTLVNIWGTYCGPCIREMPDLQELSQRLAEKDCAIIGIVCDVTDADDRAAIEAAEKIISDTGVTYLNLIPWDSFPRDLPAMYVPTTYFVNEKGEIVGEAAVGARGADEYEELLDEVLKAGPAS